MNLLHMKYAVEVARQGSLSRAAETLHTAQPNISRAMKDLESDVGFQIFQRSKRGMMLTPEGEEFIGYAREILTRLDEMELFYKQGIHPKRRFSLASPYAAYVAEAIGDLACELGEEAFDIVWHDLPMRDTLRALEGRDVHLGIIRYSSDNDADVKKLLAEKELVYELVAEFMPVLLLHKNHPLATAPIHSPADLSAYVEVIQQNAHDHSPLIMHRAISSRENDSPDPLRRISLPTPEACLEVLERCPETYMWETPHAADQLAHHQLIARRVPVSTKGYKDILVYRADHRLTYEEMQFVTHLCSARRRHMPT